MRRRSRESGQVAVETALTLPLMTFFILGVLQLGMMHQAQLMTEYAAYRAVRAGIVNDGDCERMKSAAVISLLPTMGRRVDNWGRVFAAHQQYKAFGNFIDQLMMQAAGLTRIKVEVTNPKRSQINTLFSRYGAHLDRKEIDFDDIRNDEVRVANQLTVRVRYLFELRIPFANWMIHSWYMGGQALSSLRGIQFEAQQTAFGGTATNALETWGAGRGGEYVGLALLARVHHKYFIPLQANYTMRMQSNLFSAVKNCAVDR